MLENEEKETYRLWWDYLKRGSRYKKYVNWKEAVDLVGSEDLVDEEFIWDEINLNIPSDLKEDEDLADIDGPKDSEDKKNSDDLTDSDIPPDLKEDEDILNEIYLLFGNVHKISFDEWWRKWEKGKKKNSEVYNMSMEDWVRNRLKAKKKKYDENQLMKGGSLNHLYLIRERLLEEGWMKEYYSEVQQKITFLDAQSSHKGEHIKDYPFDTLIPMFLNWIYEESQERGREPTKEEIIEGLKPLWSMQKFCFQVMYPEDPLQEIVGDFRTFLKKRREDPNALKQINFARLQRGKKTAPNKVRRELRKYLDVYDRRIKKVPYNEIIKEIGEASEKEAIKTLEEGSKKMQKSLEEDRERLQRKIDKSEDLVENYLRNYRRYFENAREIISNVEHGEFPGNYGEKKEKRNGPRL